MTSYFKNGAVFSCFEVQEKNTNKTIEIVVYYDLYAQDVSTFSQVVKYLAVFLSHLIGTKRTLGH